MTPRITDALAVGASGGLVVYAASRLIEDPWPTVLAGVGGALVMGGLVELVAWVYRKR